MTKDLATVETAPLAKPEGDSFVAFLERASNNPNFSPEAFKTIVEAKERSEAQERKRWYYADMSAMQSEIDPVAKSGENKYTGSRYVRLEDLLALLRPLFQKYGFAPSFDSTVIGKDIQYTCEMMHRSGHSELKKLTLPVDGTGSSGGKSNMNDVQKVGSSTTYARRYLLEMHLNFARRGEDDDGNGGPQCVTEVQAKQIADLVSKAPDAGKFWRFMSMGAVAPVDAPEKVLARDFKRAMAFFQAVAQGGK